MPCVLNAANEIAVNAFLDGKIKFLQMPDVVEYAMNSASWSDKLSFELLAGTDSEARQTAIGYINKIQ